MLFTGTSEQGRIQTLLLSSFESLLSPCPESALPHPWFWGELESVCGRGLGHLLPSARGLGAIGTGPELLPLPGLGAADLPLL